MKRVNLPLAALAVAALGLGACGGDDGGDDEPDITLPGGGTVPDDITIPDISIPDISIPDISIPDISIPDISMPDISLPEISDPADLLTQMFPNLSEDQAQCLADKGSSIDPSDLAGSMEIFEECDIDMSDLGG